MVAIGVIEVGSLHSGRDVARFVSELNFFLSQRLIGRRHILNREDDLSCACHLATSYGRWFAEA